MKLSFRINNEYAIEDLIGADVITNLSSVFFGVVTEDGGIAAIKLEENSLILEIEDEEDSLDPKESKQ